MGHARDKRCGLGLSHVVGRMNFPSRGSCRSAGPEARWRWLCPGCSPRRQSSAAPRAAQAPERRPESRCSSQQAILLQLLCRNSQRSGKSASSPPAASRGHQHRAQHYLTLLLASAGLCLSHTTLIAEAKLAIRLKLRIIFFLLVLLSLSCSMKRWAFFIKKMWVLMGDFEYFFLSFQVLPR